MFSSEQVPRWGSVTVYVDNELMFGIPLSLFPVDLITDSIT